MFKKSFTLFLFLTVLFYSLSFATIRRINFSGTHISGIDFDDLASCVLGSNSGDTIYVYPGNAINGDINKKLILIGTGTMLNTTTVPKGNSNQQVFTKSSEVGVISFNEGSAGSVISGFDCIVNSQFYVLDNNITIKRNYKPTVYLNASNVISSINNTQLLENYLLTVYAYSSTNGSTNLLISNNFMNYIYFYGANNSGTISNNVWANNYAETLSSGNPIVLGGGTFLFQNNILASLSDNNTPPSTDGNYNFSIDGGHNSVFNYNVSLSGLYGNPFTNQAGIGNLYVDVSTYYNTIFQGFPAIGSRTIDDRWQLKSNSIALIANRPGSTVDAGMFGGSSPYKISTMPSIPSIYQLTSPQGNNPTGNTIQINLSTKSNN